MLESNSDSFAVARAAAQSRKAPKSLCMRFQAYRIARNTLIALAVLLFIQAGFALMGSIICLILYAAMSSQPNVSDTGVFLMLAVAMGILTLILIALGIFVLRHSRIVLGICVAYSGLALLAALYTSFTKDPLGALILPALYVAFDLYAFRAAVIMRRYETGVYPSDARPKTQLP